VIPVPDGLFPASHSGGKCPPPVASFAVKDAAEWVVAGVTDATTWRKSVREPAGATIHFPAGPAWRIGTAGE